GEGAAVRARTIAYTPQAGAARGGTGDRCLLQRITRPPVADPASRIRAAEDRGRPAAARAPRADAAEAPALAGGGRRQARGAHLRVDPRRGGPSAARDRPVGPPFTGRRDLGAEQPAQGR